MKDINIVDIDYSAKKTEYKKEDTILIGDISGPWIIPEEGPIYGDNSLRVIRGGIDLIRGTDWDPVENVTDLELLTGKPVYLYVQLSDKVIAGNGEVTLVYQRVGLPTISVKTLLQMLEDMIIKGKPIDWETQVTGKQDTYYPAWHSHDIKNPNELVGFGGLVQLFSSLTWNAKKSGTKIAELLKGLQTKVFNDLNYTQRLLWGAIMGHSRNYKNPHELKPVQVDLGNVANNATATPQQDSDGNRTDLYSTPKGFARVIEESAPESEEYLMQSELPFGYYGSGIYLPPPITGSFEGLGSDVENSVFAVEGNGWLVSLFRAFDGRVKNLYYAYNTNYKDRDVNRSPWVNTYTQYRHPTITAAGKSATWAISGSDGRVLMVGDQPTPFAYITGSGNWWLCAANSTFDPSSHNLKPINMDAVIADANAVAGASAKPGNFTVALVGDWVYLLGTINSFVGDSPANYDPNLVNPENWQTITWRVPYKDLTDPNVGTINFARVNVNYDNMYRERRNNQTSFIPQKLVKTPSGIIASCAIKYDPPVNSTYLNRKKGFVIVPNPNNPRLARVKVVMSPFNSIINPDGSPYSRGFQVVLANYDWDVVSNTWTLSPNFSMPTYNILTGVWINLTQQQIDYSAPGYAWGYVAMGFASPSGSWIPGYGYITMTTDQAGPPPYTFRTLQINRDGNSSRDYEYMDYPNTWKNNFGQENNIYSPFKMKSPFGVTGFPRLYSDLYSLTTGVRQSPIEVFVAENENQTQQVFYRVTEGGADDNYDYRPALQSSFIPKPIYGRKTNSNFGIVNGLGMDIGYTNRPKRKSSESRGVGLFMWTRRGIDRAPGAPYQFTNTIMDQTGRTPVVMGDDGSAVISLDLDYDLDSVAKIVTVKANKAKQVRIPKSFYVDAVYAAMGSHTNELIDAIASFYIAPSPGAGIDQTWSMWSVTYHVKSSPNKARMIIGMFTWEVASVGADGIRVMRPVNMQYPFTSAHTNLEMTPNNPNNVMVENFLTVTDTSAWEITTDFGLQVRQQHAEILDIDGQGPLNQEIMYYPAWQINIIGNAVNPRIFMRRHNNQIVEARVQVGGWQAFNVEYSGVLCANPQWGWLQGVSPLESGGAIDLMSPFNGIDNNWGNPDDKYIMYGATYVEGNWSVFVNAEVLVTFNGYSMLAKLANWDLRDLTDVYRNQTFYMYCEANGSTARYSISKILKHHSSSSILVAVIKTDDFGIVTIDRRQSFTISGFPLTRVRDMGIPVSSGAITDQGSYKFIKRSELYND